MTRASGGRLIILHPFKKISFSLLGPGQGWRDLLRARAQTEDNVYRNYFVSGKPGLTGNISAIIPATS